MTHQLDELADHAQRLIDIGRAGDAVNILEDLVARQPDCDRYVYRLGCAYAQLGRQDVALLYLENAVVLNPGFAIFHHTLMRELIRAGGVAAARATYDRMGGLTSLPMHLRRYFMVATADGGADFDAAALAVGRVLGDHCLRLSAAEGRWGEGLVRLRFVPEGFSAEVDPSVAQRGLLIDRLVTTSVYFDRLWRALRDAGRLDYSAAWLCVDDVVPDISGPVLCFSGDADGSVLIPDSSFLESHAYQDCRALVEASNLEWAGKRSVGYWRGALTGVASAFDDVIALPRVKLCELGHSMVSAKITSVTQYDYVERILAYLGERDLLADYEPMSANLQYKYLIDIDGNSNSWPGLYTKLLTGSCVIKVMTRFRQWYYDGLVDRHNVIMVSDVSEIPAALEWCQSHEDEARAIGEQGRQFALAMTVDSEFSAFYEAWDRAKGL